MRGIPTGNGLDLTPQSPTPRERVAAAAPLCVTAPSWEPGNKEIGYGNRSYASPEWQATAYRRERRDDDDDSTHAHARPERRCSACRATNSKEAIERKEESVWKTEAAEEATERKPGGH